MRGGYFGRLTRWRRHCGAPPQIPHPHKIIVFFVRWSTQSTSKLSFPHKAGVGKRQKSHANLVSFFVRNVYTTHECSFLSRFWSARWCVRCLWHHLISYSPHLSMLLIMERMLQQTPHTPSRRPKPRYIYVWLCGIPIEDEIGTTCGDIGLGVG